MQRCRLLASIAQLRWHDGCVPVVKAASLGYSFRRLGGFGSRGSGDPQGSITLEEGSLSLTLDESRNAGDGGARCPVESDSGVRVPADCYSDASGRVADPSPNAWPAPTVSFLTAALRAS